MVKEFKELESTMQLEAKKLFELIIQRSVPDKIPMTLAALVTVLADPTSWVFTVVGPALFGWVLAKSPLEKIGIDEAEKIFNTIYEFLLKPPIWKWALLEAIGLINKSYDEII